MAVLEFVVFHPWRAVTILIVGVVLGLSTFYVYQVNAALDVVAVEDFNPDAARTAIETGDTSPSTTVFSLDGVDLEPSYDVQAELDLITSAIGATSDGPTFNVAAFGEPIDDGVFDAYLLVGSDATGHLADAIILGLQPTAGGAPIMVSLPRDLYVWNACKQSFTRLNSGLAGCSGAASGSELLAIMVEDYTGIPVDHLARVNFDGFSRLVDVMGGITVCVDGPTRDVKSHLLIEEAGCHTTDGDTALAWVRSRHPEQMIDGEWTALGGSDFTRQTHQQDALFQLAARASGFTSPASLVDKLSAVATYVRLDSGWSFTEAVGTAWRYRGISRESVRRFSIRVYNYRTSYGAAVLLPTTRFGDQLATVYDLG